MMRGDRMTFSLLHATRRLPDGWIAAYESWMERCDHPENTEYIICIDGVVSRARVSDLERFTNARVVRNLGPETPVAAFNVAASHATEEVLVVVADDWFPCEHWDTEVAKAIGDPAKECVVWIESEHCNIMTHPVLTRAYYERPDRGGCGGNLFYPGYSSFGADSDFTEVAMRDGVVVRPGITFEHRHWIKGAPMDEAYSHTNHLSHGYEEILAGRKQRDFRS